MKYIILFVHDKCSLFLCLSEILSCFFKFWIAAALPLLDFSRSWGKQFTHAVHPAPYIRRGLKHKHNLMETGVQCRHKGVKMSKSSCFGITTRLLVPKKLTQVLDQVNDFESRIIFLYFIVFAYFGAILGKIKGQWRHKGGSSFLNIEILTLSLAFWSQKPTYARLCIKGIIISHFMV